VLLRREQLSIEIDKQTCAIDYIHISQQNELHSLRVLSAGRVDFPQVLCSHSTPHDGSAHIKLLPPEKTPSNNH
jgi:hypothetical protein